VSEHDAIARALAELNLDVGDIVRQAEIDARAEVAETLKRLFADELLRRAVRELSPAGRIALAGVGEGMRPLVLDDEARLESLVRAHNDLLVEALAEGVVVPFRFGTTFADRETLDAWLERHGPQLSLELERLRGKSEWSVETVAPELPGGDRYLEERLATATLPDVRARLELVAAERSGNAYLVERERQPEFAAALSELEAAGHELRVTGPWPPYSFARLPG
jgi:hypothetical protein